MIELRGMSWDHPRGYDPMVATAKSYLAEHPDVRITWNTRSLQDFADYPVEKLAESYDLMVIDHPFIGCAAHCGCLLPIEEYLAASFLADQAANSVGQSHPSYSYGGHQWALATDAAGHVSAYRPDILERLDVETPRTWDAVIRLARIRQGAESGRVALPSIPVDALMNFCSISANAGEEPFATAEQVVSRPMGRYVLATLRSLHDAIHPESPAWNPPRTLDRMSTTDEIAYVPLLFGYSNYARPGFRPHLVRFGNVPTSGEAGPRGGILGGAGVAISRFTKHPEAAAAYARYVASDEIQRTVYFASGGQPGHRAAWLDDAVNAASSSFFRDTLETLDLSYLRPRYNGYLGVQKQAGEIIHACLTDRGEIDATLDALDRLYRESRRDG